MGLLHLPRDISIHAPVKGATGSEIDGLMGPLISIHAPVKGATCHLFLLIHQA